MGFFYGKSIAGTAIMGALLMVFCKDAGRASRYRANLGNAVFKNAPIIDTVRKIYDNIPVSAITDSADFNRIDSLLSRSTFPGSISERVDKFSRCFLGMPFSGDGPTGEGSYDTVDIKPIYNIRCFDCLTYVEHVLALALSSDARAFLPQLVRLRYKDGIIDYLHRNHFFETDWIANNNDLFTLVRPDNGIRITRTISKASFFARKRLKVPLADTVISVYAWSVEGLLAALAEKSIAPGVYIIAFIKNGHRRVMATHVGFVVVHSNAAHLRDANKTRGRVSESDLKKYLRHNAPALEGLLLARVISGPDPRLRTSR
jgi:hypothetical protein